MASSALHLQHCHENPSPQRLSDEQIYIFLNEIPKWKYDQENVQITRTFSFKTYHETLAFINACASIVHQENHHPEINFTYNRCTIKFSTHSVDGISLYDFICAAHIDQLHDQ